MVLPSRSPIGTKLLEATYSVCAMVCRHTYWMRAGTVTLPCRVREALPTSTCHQAQDGPDSVAEHCLRVGIVGPSGRRCGGPRRRASRWRVSKLWFLLEGRQPGRCKLTLAAGHRRGKEYSCIGASVPASDIGKAPRNNDDGKEARARELGISFKDNSDTQEIRDSLCTTGLRHNAARASRSPKPARFRDAMAASARGRDTLREPGCKAPSTLHCCVAATSSDPKLRRHFQGVARPPAHASSRPKIWRQYKIRAGTMILEEAARSRNQRYAGGIAHVRFSCARPSWTAELAMAVSVGGTRRGTPPLCLIGPDLSRNPGLRRRSDRGACIVGDIRRHGIYTPHGSEAGARPCVLVHAPTGASKDLYPATC